MTAPRTLRAIQVSAPVAHHGEGAVWDAVGERVLWVDMLAGRVLCTDLDGETRVVSLPDAIAAFIRPVADSSDFVVIGERTVWRLDIDDPDALPHLVAELDLPDNARANEGSCSPKGTLFVGTMTYDAVPGAGAVSALTSDGWITALSGTTISNGQQFIDDGTVVFTDSHDRRIMRFDVDRFAAWTNPAIVAIPPAGCGAPDGLCLDADGGVWVAMWDGGCAMRFDRSGALTHEVRLPTPRPTSVALGGPTMSRLFVTTSGLDQPHGANTGAGALFAADVDIPGTAVFAWSGTGGKVDTRRKRSRSQPERSS